VGPGGESNEKEPGAGVAETGNRQPPIGFVPVGGAPRGRHLEAILPESRAAFTGDDLSGHLAEGYNRLPLARIKATKDVRDRGRARFRAGGRTGGTPKGPFP
jgi:hypothetical protein